MSVFLITGNYSTIALICIFQHTELNVFSLLSTSLHENASLDQASVLHQVCTRPHPEIVRHACPNTARPGSEILTGPVAGMILPCLYDIDGNHKMLTDGYATDQYHNSGYRVCEINCTPELRYKAYLVSCWDLSPQVETFSLFFA